MKFLVVGYGQIGRELVRQLTERGDRVTVVKRSGMPQRRGVEVMRGDVQDALSELGSEGFDGVFNCIHAPYSARACGFPRVRVCVGDRSAGAEGRGTS